MKKSFAVLMLAALCLTCVAQEDLTRSRNLSTVNPIDTWVLTTDGRWNKWKSITNILSTGTVMPAWDISAATNGNATTLFSSGTLPNARLDSDLQILSSFAMSADMTNFLKSANYAFMRTNLSLRIGTDVQAYDADLTTWAGVTPSANGQVLVTNAYEQMREYLGLKIGTDVQAFDADLTTWAGVTPSANGQVLVTNTYEIMRTYLGLVIGTDVQAQIALRSLSGDKITDATITQECLADLAVSLPKLASAVTTNIYPALTVTPAVINPGTNDVTVQVKNLGGANPTTNVLIRVWTAATANGAPSSNVALNTLTTGTVLKEHTTGCQWDILTDASGKAVVHMVEAESEFIHTNFVMGAVGGITAYGASVTSSNSP